MPDDPNTWSVYYPSLIVNFQLRFDEGLTALPAGVTPKSAQQLADSPPAPDTGVPELVVLAPGDDNLSKLLGITPKSCSVELPGYRQAGTFSVDLEYKDLPLDPRVIRSMRVDVHLGAVSAGDFADGMTMPVVGRRRSILAATSDNWLISGVADSIDVEHSSKGSFVHMEGRDLRGILLDASITPDTLHYIIMSAPIDSVVRQILSLIPFGKGIPVVTSLPSEWPPDEGGYSRVPSPGDPAMLPRSAKDAAGANQVSSTRGDASQLKVWDLITQVCFMVGAIPYFTIIPGTGPALAIRPSRNLYYWRHAEQNPATAETAFAGKAPRTLRPPLVTSPEQIVYRRMVYGRDIESLKYERKLGGTKVPGVVARSIDTSCTQRGINPQTGLPYNVVQAQWPPETNPQALTTGVATGGKDAATDYLIIPVTDPPVRDVGRLKHIAQDLYEEIGRQEIGGSVQTKSLASFGGNNQDPDLLKIRPGDPISIQVPMSGPTAFPPDAAELTIHEGRSREEEAQAIFERTGDMNLANVLVAMNRNEIQQLVREFRVGNVKYDWQAESGLALSFDFQNFVEVRSGITPHNG